MISKFFLQLGWVEEIGTGIYNVNRYLPIYTPGGKASFKEDVIFTTTIPIPNPEDTPQVTIQDTVQDKDTPHDTRHDTRHDTPHDTHHDTPEVTPEVTTNVTMEVKKFLKVFQGAMSREDLLSRLDLKDRENLREIYLKPALELGFIELTLPGKLKSKKQKYRITEKGKIFLQNIQVTPQVTKKVTAQDKDTRHDTP